MSTPPAWLCAARSRPRVSTQSTISSIAPISERRRPFLPLGDYDVQVTLLDVDEAVLGDSQTRQEILDVGNEIVDLGNFDFTVVP